MDSFHSFWQVRRNSQEDHYVDAYNILTSNWLRFLNCPRDEPEENVKVYECYGKIYYMTTKDVYPGTELLVHYGEAYAKELGIEYDGYSGYTWYTQRHVIVQCSCDVTVMLSWVFVTPLNCQAACATTTCILLYCFVLYCMVWLSVCLKELISQNLSKTKLPCLAFASYYHCDYS